MNGVDGVNGVDGADEVVRTAGTTGTSSSWVASVWRSTLGSTSILAGFTSTWLTFLSATGFADSGGVGGGGSSMPGVIA